MGGVIDIADVFGMDLKTATVACGGPSGDTSSTANNSGPVVENLEKQKMAENFCGHPSQYQTQHTAISLGKSSSTLHIPFPHASSPQASVENELRPYSEEVEGEIVDVVSPGLTPIGSQRPSLILRGGNSAFPLTGDHSGMGYTPQAGSAIGGASSDYFRFHRGESDEKGDMYGNGRGRRVSFGPPSRLSFSSFGGDEEGDAELDEIPPSKYPRRSSQHGQGRQRSEISVDDTSGTSGGILGKLGTPGARVSKLPVSTATKDRKSTSPPAPVRRRSGSNTSPAKPTQAVSPTASRKPQVPLSPPGRHTAGVGLRSPPRRLSPTPTTGKCQSAAGGNRTRKSTPSSKKNAAAEIPNEENEEPKNKHENIDFEEQNSTAKVDYYGKEKQQAKAIVAIFAAAQQFLSQYQCKEALDILRHLPETHLKSGYANQLIGKAYYEMGDYRACLLAMREMLRLEPFRIRGTETMSTAMWHMKSKKELCSLGQQVILYVSLTTDLYANTLTLHCR